MVSSSILTLAQNSLMKKLSKTGLTKCGIKDGLKNKLPLFSTVKMLMFLEKLF
jgi:hypothetical protein